MRHAPIVGAIAIVAAAALAPLNASAATAAKSGSATQSATPSRANTATSGSSKSATAQSSALKAADKKFIDTAAIGDKYEIDAAGIAQMRAQSDDVKMFAQMMVTDHNKSTDELKSTLMKINANVTPPAMLDAQHRKMINTLQNASAQTFDNIYIAQQAQAHQQAVKLFKDYSMKGSNAELKMFASTVLPTIQGHVEKIQSIQKMHRGNAQANAGASATRQAQNATNKSRK